MCKSLASKGMTAQQQQVFEAGKNLLDVLEEVVPHTTIHYAVEQVRLDLRTLLRLVDDLRTEDYPRLVTT